MASTEGRDVAEAHDECEFRRFGASEMIRHDRYSRFMGRKQATRDLSLSNPGQRAVIEVRANGNPKCQGIRANCGPSDWDELAENLMILRHHPARHNVLRSARLGCSTYCRSHDGRHPPRHTTPGLQRQVEYTGSWDRDLQAKAKGRLAEDHNRRWKQLTDRLKERFEPESAPGSPRNWPISETAHSGSWKRVVISDTPSRSKSWTLYPEQPSVIIDVPEDDDFDAALLREDSWKHDEGSGEYEVEVILDVRWITRTRANQRVKEYLTPDWITQEWLNCGGLRYEFDRGERARVRFQAMQSGDRLQDEEVR
ncbi:LOW QUALITY PROTEIN: hypothetical protein PHMEG_00034698 [Phytophthora megakarya]|uniref:Reverse transcriptase n=1 Tax=Phytophthora megakarya TaxID=4795 RepID=A0A225UQC0_9STRA|nr:LOW QUALITY PROTEIN: hypothetical protein PHMEG_00034698 [Phytophthora megakarya]